MTLHNFEAHVTVDGRRRYQWEEHCRELDVKPVKILLDSGEHPTQTMCTQHFGGPVSQEDAKVAVLELMGEIRRRGHTVLRAKLESDISLPRLFQADYYEAHVKLALDARDGTPRATASDYGLAMSRSLLRPRADGKLKWFLTDRVPGSVLSHDAVAVFEETLGLIRRRYPQAEMEQEIVVFDTNPSLDAGWLNADLGAIS